MIRDVAALLEQVHARRMRELLVDFGSLPCPADDTAVAAEWYAGYLRALGAAEVRILRDHPRTPTVVAGFPGIRRAPIFQIHGHIQALPPGSPRAIYAGGKVIGRGLIASRAELIAAAEAARILAGVGPLPGGGLLIVVTSRGPSPEEEDQDILACIRRGIVGDAVLLTGGDHHIVPVAGLGLGTFRATFSPRYIPAHERSMAAPAYTAIDAARVFLNLLQRKRALLARMRDPHTGSESIFVSGISGGDRFDLLPASCSVEGNWRWLPERNEGDVFRELEHIAQHAARLRDARVDLTLSPIREGYRIDARDPLVHALQSAHQYTCDRPLPLGTSVYASSTRLFQRQVGVTAISHGVDTATFRRDQEEVSVDEVVRVARLYLCLILNFLTYPQLVTAADSYRPVARAPVAVCETIPDSDGYNGKVPRAEGIMTGVEGA